MSNESLQRLVSSRYIHDIPSALEWNFYLVCGSSTNLFSFLSLSLDMDFLIHGYSLYSTDLEKLVNPPVDGVAWNLYDARYRESWGCVRVLDGWFCEIFFHPGVRKLLYCSEYTCNASSRNHSMEVCCSTGNYYIGRWNFTKLCFDPRNAGFLRSKNFFFSPFFFLSFFVGIRRID